MAQVKFCARRNWVYLLWTVCVCVCVCVYIYIYIYIYMHVCINACMHVCVCIYVYGICFPSWPISAGRTFHPTLYQRGDLRRCRRGLTVDGARQKIAVMRKSISTEYSVGPTPVGQAGKNTLHLCTRDSIWNASASHWAVIGHSMTALPPVLSPDSIVTAPSFFFFQKYCYFVLFLCF